MQALPTAFGFSYTNQAVLCMALQVDNTLAHVQRELEAFQGSITGDAYAEAMVAILDQVHYTTHQPEVSETKCQAKWQTHCLVTSPLVQCSAPACLSVVQVAALRTIGSQTHPAIQQMLLTHESQMQVRDVIITT